MKPNWQPRHPGSSESLAQPASRTWPVFIFSVGSGTGQYATRRIVNVAAGGQASDAATVGQLSDSLAALGGGADVAPDGTVVGPAFSVQGTTQNTVGGALAALDAQVTANRADIDQLDSRVGNLEQQVGVLQGAITFGGSGAGSGTSIAVGQGASTGGDNGTAMGSNSHAAGDNDTALGGHAHVGADGSTAVGANSNVATGATNSVAVGADSSVTAASGTARATATGAVALGQGSVADEADTVSVGRDGHERRITHVADGTEATANSAGLGGRHRLALGYGHYQGHNATAISYQQAFRENLASVGVTVATDLQESIVAAGLGFSW